MPFLSHEMLADRIERGEIDYAAIAEPRATLSDLDPLEFDRLRRMVGVSSGDASVIPTLGDFEIGRALGAWVSTGVVTRRCESGWLEGSLGELIHDGGLR